MRGEITREQLDELLEINRLLSSGFLPGSSRGNLVARQWEIMREVFGDESTTQD